MMSGAGGLAEADDLSLSALRVGVGAGDVVDGPDMMRDRPMEARVVRLCAAAASSSGSLRREVGGSAAKPLIFLLCGSGNKMKFAFYDPQADVRTA
jgi:hypothetical protein